VPTDDIPVTTANEFLALLGDTLRNGGGNGNGNGGGYA